MSVQKLTATHQAVGGIFQSAQSEEDYRTRSVETTQTQTERAGNAGSRMMCYELMSRHVFLVLHTHTHQVIRANCDPLGHTCVLD